MSWDLSKLGNCAIHGHHAGSECPLCDANHVTAAPMPESPATPAAPVEDRSTWWPGPEKELHDLFALEMLRLGVSYIHCRTDQKSTIANGWPDFTCMRCGDDGIPRVCMVELKNRAGRTSKDQIECIDDLRAKSLPVLVTGDFRESSEFVKQHLAITQPIT